MIFCFLLGAQRAAAQAAAPDTEADLVLDGEERAAPAGPERETAIRTVVVAVFSQSEAAGQPLPDAARARFCKLLEQELNLKTYLEGKCLLKVAKADASQDRFVEIARQGRADGVLAGDFRGDEVAFELRSGQSGRVLLRASTKMPEKFDGAGKRQVLNAIVEEIIERQPYRGFVTKTVNGLVHVNLGERHGLEPGARLRVFEFAGEAPTFESATREIGFLRVTEINGDETAMARPVGRTARIPDFAKVQVDNPETKAMTARSRVGPAGWLSVGGELQKVTTELENPRYKDRQYGLNYTPFVVLGLGRGPWGGYLWYGRAVNSSDELTSLALQVSRETWVWGDADASWIVSLGAWASRYSVHRKAVSPDNLRATDRIAPYFDVRYQLMPRPRLKVFAGAEFYYPLLVTGQPAEMIPYGFGAAPYGGTRLDLSSSFGLELGARLLYLRMPLKTGRQGTNETQTGLLGRMIYMY